MNIQKALQARSPQAINLAMASTPQGFPREKDSLGHVTIVPLTSTEMWLEPMSYHGTSIYT